MYINKSYITDLKYATSNDDLLTGENFFISQDIERAFANSGYNFEYETLSREVIITMIYFLNVRFYPCGVEGKYRCNKLENEYSLQYWLYREIYINSEKYSSVMGKILWNTIPSPDEIENIPQSLLDELGEFIVPPEVIEDNNETNKSEIISVRINGSSKNILWVTRHHMFKEQYDALSRLYGNNVKIFQYKARVLDYKTILKICERYGISVVAVVLPDDLIITLRNKLPEDIKIIRAKVTEVPEASYTILNAEGEFICNSTLYANGFEEVKGYTLITADVEVM